MRQRLGPLLAAAASVVVLLATGVARGQHTTTASRFSAYEKETIEHRAVTSLLTSSDHVK